MSDAPIENSPTPLQREILNRPPITPMAQLAYQPGNRVVPNYRVLRICAGIMMIVSVLFYLAGAGFIIYVANQYFFHQQRSYFRSDDFAMAMFALLLIGAGGFFHFAAAASLTLRDIARNTFSART